MAFAGLAVTASTDDVLGEAPKDPLTLLSPAERARADGLRRLSDRWDFVAAHILVRLCAASVLGEAAARINVVQRCEVCGGPHGRPVLAGHDGWHASLSHSAGVVAAAVARTPVGVDVERTGAGRVDRSLANVVLTPAEATRVESAADPARAFVRLWVRKESLVKLGVATLDDMARLDLSALPIDVDRGTEPTPLEFDGLRLLDWVHPVPAAAAAAASLAPLQLVGFGELGLTSRQPRPAPW